jgi:hypothetical protein
MTSTDRIDDDWPVMVTPISLSTQPAPRPAISAHTTATIGKIQKIGLR